MGIGGREGDLDFFYFSKKESKFPYFFYLSGGQTNFLLFGFAQKIVMDQKVRFFWLFLIKRSIFGL